MQAIMLFLQAAPATVADDIAGHPYLFLLFVTFLFSVLVALLKLFLTLFEKRINERFELIDGEFDKVQAHEIKQDERLEKIEYQLRQYDTHVAVGVKETSEIHAAMSRVETTLGNHVQKEETVTWNKIDALVDAVNTLRLTNENAHSNLNTGQAVLGTRVEQLEKKMPNGELQKLADAFMKLANSKGSTRVKK